MRPYEYINSIRFAFLISDFDSEVVVCDSFKSGVDQSFVKIKD